MDSEIGLDDAYAVDGPDENRKLYARWASSYDETFIERQGYRYHSRVARIFAEHGGVGPVLDVGCGTGAVGVELANLGVAPIDGVDISSEMLSEARRKTASEGPVYRDLIEADLTSATSLRTSSYSGLISAGTFTHGHLGPQTLAELFSTA